jgi:hypothetical protein
MSNANPLFYRPKIGLDIPTKLPKPYELCWCGSGVKFKKCHRLRESEPAANAFSESANMRAAGKVGKCLHPGSGGGSCSSASIASHTVQRGGGLSAIAEQGHVLTTFVDYRDLRRHHGTPEPRRIGIKEASTFPGFCNTHDSALFSPIEQATLTIDPETAFLFLYRVMSLELVRKQKVIESLPALKRADRGSAIDRQIETQATLAPYEHGLLSSQAAMISRKSAADAKLVGRDWSDIHYCQIEFDGLLPITTACAFYPEFDWTGKRLQYLTRVSPPLDELGFTITSYQNRTSVVFVWTGSKTGIQRNFVETFLAIPDAEKAERITAFCFETSENSQLKPSWWQALAAPTRKFLSAKMWNGTTRKPHEAKAMRDRAPLPTALATSNIVHSWV